MFYNSIISKLDKNINMIVVTTNDIPGKEISEVLGLVRGSTVRARNFGSDFMAGLKNLVGGEITEYTKLVANSREQALARMEADAVRLNADAVLAIRFESSTLMQGATEVMCYGTAVKLKKAE